MKKKEKLINVKDENNIGFKLSLLIDELTRRETDLRAKHRIVPKLLLEKELKVKARIGKAVVIAMYRELPHNPPIYGFVVPNRPELEFDSQTFSKIENIMEQFQMERYEELGGGLLLFSEGKFIVDLSRGGFSIVKDYPRIKELADILVKLYAHDL